MENIVNVILNSGVAIGVVVYFVLKDWKFNTEIIQLLGEVRGVLETIKSWKEVETDDVHG